MPQEQRTYCTAHKDALFAHLPAGSTVEDVHEELIKRAHIAVECQFESADGVKCAEKTEWLVRLGPAPKAIADSDLSAELRKLGVEPAAQEQAPSAVPVPPSQEAQPEPVAASEGVGGIESLGAESR